MNVALFGTGRVFKRYRKYWEKCNVVYLIDNDVKKQGTLIEGIKVIAAEEASYDRCDYILILTDYYQEIEIQLAKLGVLKEKIIPYTKMGEILGEEITIYSLGKKIPLKDWLEQETKRSCKKIMLCSHHFEYTGVPVALMNLAKALKDENYHVVLASRVEGDFIRELEENKIDYIPEINIFYESDNFLEIIKKFDLFIPSTILLAKMVNVLAKTNKPVLWWIHESSQEFYKEKNLIPIPSNVHLFGCANRVVKKLKTFYPNEKIEYFYYCIPDKKKITSIDKDSELVFGIIGSICERKAQDVLLEAIYNLPMKCRNRFKIYLIGEIPNQKDKYWESIKKLISGIPEIILTGKLTQEQVREYYSKIDVLICPSRDDPMPIVVTEAMMYEKVCIVSENVGQAEFIEQKKNGFVIKNENSKELASYIEWVIDNKDRINAIGKNARKIYEERFTQKSIQERIKTIMEQYCIDN